MKRLSHALKIFVATVFTLALCSVAQAQVTSFVSAEDGNDANTCTRTSPCQTFAGAIAKTAAGGMITALDSGNFGPVTIDKTFTIDGGKGNVATIFFGTGNGITVTAGLTDTVIVRNVVIVGRDTATSGVHYTSGGLLHLYNVTIERFAGQGFFMEGTSAANPLRAEIDNSRFEGNVIGIQQENHTKLAVRNCVIIGTLHKGGPPLSFGVNVLPAAGSAADTKLENNEISYCQSGVRAASFDVGGGDVELWARNNHIYGNTFGVNLTASVIYHTTSDNRLSDNGTPLLGGLQAGTTNW